MNRLTPNEMAELLGAPVTLQPIRGLRVACIITNVKISYGHQRVQIQPVAGEGRAWVSWHRIEIREELLKQDARKIETASFLQNEAVSNSTSNTNYNQTSFYDGDAADIRECGEIRRVMRREARKP
jgi:hypothetical protein